MLIRMSIVFNLDGFRLPLSLSLFLAYFINITLQFVFALKGNPRGGFGRLTDWGLFGWRLVVA